MICRLFSCLIGFHWLIGWLTAATPVINEIHHSPDVKQEPVEFIELYLPGDHPVDLSGWSFTGGVNFTFPDRTILGPGEFLVIGQNPTALQVKFGIPNALGPWTGRLAGEGERVRLRNAAGDVVDQVEYGQGFPWPTVGDAPGYSMELIHPDLDNDLGGHWRSSVIGNPNPVVVPLVTANAEWRFFKGTAAPPATWTSPSFNDSGWMSGAAPLGYDPEVRIRTEFADMRGAYTQFFLRRAFSALDPESVTALRVEALYDDGYKLWLNGVLLAAKAMPTVDVPFNATASGGARESNEYERVEIPLPRGLLREGQNTLAVQVANVGLGNSSDCFFDLRLFSLVGPTGRGPTPGETNAVFSLKAPPAIRQVRHEPAQPRGGQSVTVSARVTDPDGVANVTLEYQTVAPGSYIRADEPAFQSQWISLGMNPAPADTNLFLAELPPQAAQHRHLIRYRIRAQDSLGEAILVPYADDPQRNFAFFVYDGVPAWTGAIRPGAAGALGARFTAESTEMNRLPVYHLIAHRRDVEDATWYDRSHGDEYYWSGTLVYKDRVYDHVRFRPRGGVWRYAMGKNMWKFDFNRGHDFEPDDNWGRPLATPWSKLNLGANIQQGNFLHRGEQGLFESVGFRIFQLAGVPASHTALVQFRIIDDAAETDPHDQFGGDFWGLYLAIEQLDGRFLDEHGLPDGNFYKMESGTGEPNNLGPGGPVDGSDLSAFQSAYEGLAGDDLTESWWRTNLNLESYYNYQIVVQAIHHYDIANGKNYFYYHNPVDRRWTVIPWDLDLTWADNMYHAGQTGGDEPFKNRVLSNFGANPRFPALALEFRNRVREFRDLFWNADEAYRLIDEYYTLARGPNLVSLIDADRARWDYHPIMTNFNVTLESKAGQGLFYRFPLYSGIPRVFDSARTIMKRYVTYRASNPTFSLDTLAREPDRPATPTLTYLGPAGFPVNQLRWGTSPFQGDGAIRSIRWRIGEISRADHSGYRADEPMRYEIEAVWDSGELSADTLEATTPADALQMGRLYRARVRHTDILGRASSWSAPIEFTAGIPEQAALLRDHLRLTEIMYHPPDAGFEFLELHNASASRSLPVGGATFTSGVQYTFPEGAALPPGGYLLVIRTADVEGFRAYHGLGEDTQMFGPYDGALDNAGEPLGLAAAAGQPAVLSWAYDDLPPWPTQADGEGYSLVARENGAPDPSVPRHWRRSAALKGSPGRSDPAPPLVAISGFEGGAAPRIQVTASGDTPWAMEASNDLLRWTVRERFLGGASFIPSLDSPEPRYYRPVFE